ncbi:MAG: hypothetical protein AW09_002640 [Candidatus Accumulibacter phosphatis]|uniref:Uncharacterized protein n=1 Tax=Candidatus Accumulibacter phosphatis TaxID=327160 RepID=A0A080LUB5_9PROT|nr:MAG: hypothetical protein AW09_002640 [Candidatus Accumulibacter phosphatis]
MLHLAAERGKIRASPPPSTSHYSCRHDSLMSIPTHSTPLASIPKLDPVLCSSAATRLLWAIAALLLLWMTVFWALD